MHFIITMIYCALLGKNAALNKLPVAEKAEEMIQPVVFVLCAQVSVASQPTQYLCACAIDAGLSLKRFLLKIRLPTGKSLVS